MLIVYIMLYLHVYYYLVYRTLYHDTLNENKTRYIYILAIMSTTVFN